MPILVTCDNCGKEESGFYEDPDLPGVFSVGLPLGWSSRGFTDEQIQEHPGLPKFNIVCSLRCGIEYDTKHGIFSTFKSTKIHHA